MNKVILMGRLTRDPEVRYTDGGVSIAKFSLAVDRRFKRDNGPTADFFNCTSFGKQAEFVEKYLHRGTKSFFREESKTTIIQIRMAKKSIAPRS